MKAYCSHLPNSCMGICCDSQPGYRLWGTEAETQKGTTRGESEQS